MKNNLFSKKLLQAYLPPAIAAAVLLIVIGVALALAFGSHAATPNVSSEPENGTFQTPATKVLDTTASGGSAIKFEVGTIWGQGNPVPPSVTVLNQISLGEASVMQSFAYDSAHKIWIMAQVMGPDHFNESAAEHALDGDMTLTKVSANGQVLGVMYLNGFGHGVSIGVEPVGSASYVWTESNAKLASGSANAFGTQVARFAWSNDATITPDSSSVATFNAVSGASSVTPMVDAAKNRIALQYNKGGYHWSVYALDAFMAKHFTPLVTVARPAAANSLTYQGWTWLTDQTILSLYGEKL